MPSVSEESDHEPKSVSTFVGWLIAVPTLLATIVVGAYVWQFHDHEISDTVERWGQSGDYIGGILNPILAFASLLAVCYTLWLQFKNAARSARFNAVQKLEALLFELIRLHRDNLASIDLWDEQRQRETEGRDCFVAFLAWIRANHQRAQVHNPTEASLAEAYRVFYEDRGRKTEVGHYFRNLYHIFKYITESSLLSDAERLKYAKLVRAQLSMPETAMLFYNGLHPAGKAFRKYIRTYTLLQELEPSDLGIAGLTKELMVQIYGEEAFTEPPSAA